MTYLFKLRPVLFPPEVPGFFIMSNELIALQILIVFIFLKFKLNFMADVLTDIKDEVVIIKKNFSTLKTGLEALIAKLPAQGSISEVDAQALKADLQGIVDSTNAVVAELPVDAPTPTSDLQPEVLK